MEWAEKLESQLNGYIKVHSDHPQALLLRAKLKLTLVAIQSERGAAAIDYWAFISDVVDPIRYAALADLQSVLKHTSDTKLIAETHYFLAQYYFAADEADQALIDQELKTACDGGYQKACQNLK